MPRPDYLRRCRDRSIDVTARQDSINWIWRVHAHYRFRPITAFLSVNYFDRFLSFHSLPREANGWAFQLLSVACVSLAAKMEEPDVPLLLDLQVFDPKFVFEPRTVQRMELWVMSNLNWRLRSVTPFDFLHSFVPKLPSLSSSPPSLRRVLSASSDLILSTTRVIDFLGFTPSTIAAAAVLCAAGQGGDEPRVFHDSLDTEMVRSCRQLMEEYLVDTCPSATVKVAEEPEPPAAPPSPVGVLDAAACRSCDTRSADKNPIAAATSQAEPPRQPPPPPPPRNKRLRFSAPESSDVQEH
ncbi:Cyclin N-terminal domain-containing protein [Psidium guajava]|nr:Cyclin N-terminal domain-containing protein [Psidium guajava]